MKAGREDGTMMVGFHKPFFKGYSAYIERFEKILDYNGIGHIRLECDDPDFWSQATSLDLFVFWWRHDNGDWRLANSLIPIIESKMGVKCLPDVSTCWTYDDKIRQFYLLRHHGFPVVDSWVFWDKQKALDWAETADLPLVFKLTGGAGSENVSLVRNRDRAAKLIRRMFGQGIQSTRIPWGNTRWRDFNLKKEVRHWVADRLRELRGVPLPDLDLHKNYAYFQRFLPGNEYDTRITVIGNRAFGFRRYTRDGDFRASGSGKIDYATDGVDKRFIQLALQISRKMQFQSMAYDFLYDEKRGPAICEISYNFVDEAVYACPGYWDDSLDWHEGNWWPQYFQLMDALGLRELKQPNLKGGRKAS
jgi:hypothetical protein